MMIYKLVRYIFLILLSLPAVAHIPVLVNKAPINCYLSQVFYSKDQMIFNRGKTNDHLFFIHNMTLTPLIVTHIKESPGAGAGWASRLNPGEWSALHMHRSDFTFNCYDIYDKGELTQVSCENSVIICTADSKEAAAHADISSYWVAENQAFSQILEQVEKRGFILKNKPRLQ